MNDQTINVESENTNPSTNVKPVNTDNAIKKKSTNINQSIKVKSEDTNQSVNMESENTNPSTKVELKNAAIEKIDIKISDNHLDKFKKAALIKFDNEREINAIIQEEAKNQTKTTFVEKMGDKVWVYAKDEFLLKEEATESKDFQDTVKAICQHLDEKHFGNTKLLIWKAFNNVPPEIEPWESDIKQVVENKISELAHHNNITYSQNTLMKITQPIYEDFLKKESPVLKKLRVVLCRLWAAVFIIFFICAIIFGIYYVKGDSAPGLYQLGFVVSIICSIIGFCVFCKFLHLRYYAKLQ